MTLNRREIIIPDGKDFIFSIFDDTDVSTLGNIKPVYDFLYSQEILTTKSVWPPSSDAPESDYRGSETLENKDYADYVKLLSERGFEIAFHGASMESNRREQIIEAIDYFNKVLGFYPRTYASHAGNMDNLFWGENRFTFPCFRFLYRLLTRSDRKQYSGHLESSPYYWGDICSKYFDYVRTFTFDELNLLRVGKFPYSIDSRPCINDCFYTHFADHVEEFNRLLSEANQEKLQQQRGLLIITTHFGKGFVKDGVLNPTTQYLLKQLVNRNGYFAPVCDVLDLLKSTFGSIRLQNKELFLLEWKWFVHAYRQKKNKLDYEKNELQYLGLK
jgi:hypothetical protein